MRTVRALLLMLVVPFALLLAHAHIVGWRSPVWLEWATFAGAAIVGLIGLLTAPWSRKIRARAAIAYVPLFLLSLPYQGLIATCTTGNCL